MTTTTMKMEEMHALLNEKELALKERELALEEQQEEFFSQTEELNTAIEELMSKNAYLTTTLDELKQRNNELDQILYRASHDLKTPVSSILGLISIMQTTNPNAEQQSILGHMLQKTYQMESLLASLSALSIAFFRQLTPEHCSVSDIFHSTLAKVKHGDAISVDCEVGNLSCTTDKVLLEIMLAALLKNAVDFSIPYSKNHIVIRAEMFSSCLRIEVSDTGEEIPEDISEKIFQMFYRGSIYSKGPGLGLYIVQRIVKRFGGQIILVNGIPRKTFVITLPQI